MKIIQILVVLDDQRWKNRLLGLGDDGVVYVFLPKNNEWAPI